MTSRGKFQWLASLCFVSSLGSVVYEVLFLRYLTTYLGDTYWVHTTLVATFLLGAGLGALWAHRMPRYLFAGEASLGLYALAFPSLLWMYRTSLFPHVGGNPLFQSFGTSFVFLFLPSLAIGITVPLYAEYLKRTSPSPSTFSTIYMLYNLGAAAGILAGEYLLIRTFGFGPTLFGVAGCNLICAAILWRKRSELVPTSFETDSMPEQISHSSLIGMFLVGLGASWFLGFYFKFCYHLLLPHRENFAICTAATLLLIVMGTNIASRIRMNLKEIILLAIFSLGVIYILTPNLLLTYRRMDAWLPSWAYMFRSFFFVLVLGLPYAWMGAVIPRLTEGKVHVARWSGRLLFVSGLGNACGLLLYTAWGFEHLPFFSAIPLIMFFLVLAAWRLEGSFCSWTHRGLLAFSLVLGTLALRVPERMLFTIYDPPPAQASVTTLKKGPDHVSLIRTPTESHLIYNGNPSIMVEDKRGANPNEILVGAIPFILSQNPREALVIGLGTGISAGTTATLFAHTDIVEINAAFFPLARQLSHLNFQVMQNPHTTLIYDDARRFLEHTPKRYDAILSTAAAPAYYAAGKLYTKEFLETVKRHLQPGGTYHTWIGPVEMSNSGTWSLLQTLHEEFDRCNLAILQRRYYLLSCASRELPLPRIENIHLPSAIAGHLHRIQGLSPESYVANTFVSSNIFAGTPMPKPGLNLDTFPRLEFSIMKANKIMRGDPSIALDLLVAHPEMFHVVLPEQESPERVIQRALTFSHLHPQYFRRIYGDYLNQHRPLKREFVQTMGKAFLEDLSSGLKETEREVVPGG